MPSSWERPRFNHWSRLLSDDPTALLPAGGGVGRVPVAFPFIARPVPLEIASLTRPLPPPIPALPAPLPPFVRRYPRGYPRAAWPGQAAQPRQINRPGGATMACDVAAGTGA